MSASGEKVPYLHVRVSDALRSRITNREVLPGSILPSEMDLTAEFGVSRSVVRQALRTLADEGLVEVVRGRGAVVCAHREWHRDAQRTAGLSAQMRALGARVTTQVLSHSTRTDPDHGQRLGTGEVLVLERLRFLDGEPVAYIRTWLPAWVATSLTPEVLEDASLHVHLHERAGVQVHGGPRQIRAIGAAGQVAERLGVPAGSPVLLLEGESLDERGEPVEVFSAWHRSDRIALDISILDPFPEVSAGPGGGPGPQGQPPPDALRRAEAATMEALRLIRAAASP